jgi:2-hydroxychromene-2-carboxylate isomerase
MDDRKNQNFPVTPELLDGLNDIDATWPHDPAVPELPPMPDTDETPAGPDSFLNSHFQDGVHTPVAQGVPALRSRDEPVTEEDPLKVDVCWSMRSPYSYLVLNRLVWLNSNYCVDVNIRPVMPVAVRSTKGGSGKAGGLFGITYKVPDATWDTVRMGEFLGVPFKYARPDPIWQTYWPPFGKNFLMVHPVEKQPYIHWITRLACYASLKGKALEMVNEISPLIWGGHVEHWPAHVKEAFNKIEGLDYDKAIKDIQDDGAKKVDAVWTENSAFMAQTGHGGVPLMVINGEPCFGGDRFDPFVDRLRQNGLTKRRWSRAPFTTKPLRWPLSD